MVSGVKAPLIALLALLLCLTALAQNKTKPLPKDIPSLKFLAEKKDARAQYQLGMIYYMGREVDRDFKQALKWFGKAAEKGHAAAQFVTARAYHTGFNVEKNNKVAFKWYSRAAEQGHPQSQINIGNMYYFGTWVKEDFEEAVSWYRKAAEQGVAAAQYKLGSMYEAGKGVRKSTKDALNWYLKAAERGVAESQLKLGVMYASLGEENGVAKDNVTAYAWADIASTSGTLVVRRKLAKQMVDLLAKQMADFEVAEAQALAKELRKKIEVNLKAKKE